jgi:hypothetical protein
MKVIFCRGKMNAKLCESQAIDISFAGYISGGAKRCVGYPGVKQSVQSAGVLNFKEYEMFFECRCDISYGESMTEASIPIMHSRPRTIECPKPGRQQSQVVIRLLAFNKIFQKSETVLEVSVSTKSQLIVIRLLAFSKIFQKSETVLEVSISTKSQLLTVY